MDDREYDFAHTIYIFKRKKYFLLDDTNKIIL